MHTQGHWVLCSLIPGSAQSSSHFPTVSFALLVGEQEMARRGAWWALGFSSLRLAIRTKGLHQAVCLNLVSYWAGVSLSWELNPISQPELWEAEDLPSTSLLPSTALSCGNAFRQTPTPTYPL